MRIESIAPDRLIALGAELAALLRGVVENGASIGFTLPLRDVEVTDYWSGVWAEVAAGRKILLAALDEDDRIMGSAQLALESRANGRHRAEVQKVMVQAALRGRDIGTALIARVEAEARARGRTLLVLDTSAGASGAASFYERLGYQWAGGIPDYASDPNGQLVPNVIYYKKLG
jgi:ribosomal protein S18 acetylase RimI-like enzyme